MSQAGGTAPRWRRDGREIFFLTPGRDQLYAVDLELAGGALDPAVPHLLFKVSRRLADYDVTADGQRFLVKLAAGQSKRQRIHVLLNWTPPLQ